MMYVWNLWVFQGFTRVKVKLNAAVSPWFTRMICELSNWPDRA